MDCPDCNMPLENISTLHRNKTEIYRCNNETCNGFPKFYNKDLRHPMCHICGSKLSKIDHIIPDLYIDAFEDNHFIWVCRNCAIGMILIK